MSMEETKKVIEDFLQRENPEVLAIKGKWGIGKTYVWKQLFKNTIRGDNKEKLALDNYSYVSLFGISSMDELKSAVFIKTHNIKDPSTTDGSGNRAFHKHKKLLDSIPGINKISVPLGYLVPSEIEKTYVCLDDFERMTDCSTSLTAEQVLGFISQLKEENNCKVIFIFNEEKLEGDKNSVYQKYREKVVDIEIEFNPTIDEAMNIAFQEDVPYLEIIKENCKKLDIKNIRVLNKIKHFSCLVYEKVKNFHPRIMEEAIPALVLISASVYMPGQQNSFRNEAGSSKHEEPKRKVVHIPPLHYLKSLSSSGSLKPIEEILLTQNRSEESPEEKEKNQQLDQWRKTLHFIGGFRFHTRLNEFDESLLFLVESGFFGRNFDHILQNKHQDIQNGDLTNKYYNVWNLYLYTFSDNTDEFIEKLQKQFKESVSVLKPHQVDEAVTSLRSLGYDEIADDLINYYVQNFNPNNIENNSTSLLERLALRSIKDTKLLSHLKKLLNNTAPQISLKESILHIYETHGWSKDQEDCLLNASTQEYYELFNQTSGEELHAIVSTCLDASFNSSIKPTVAEKAREALIRIGKDNVLNKLRVKSIYNIDIDQEPIEASGK